MQHRLAQHWRALQRDLTLTRDTWAVWLMMRAVHVAGSGAMKIRMARALADVATAAEADLRAEQKARRNG